MGSKHINEEAKRHEVAAVLEDRFPGSFSINQHLSRFTYSAGANGAHACEYKVHVQPHDRNIDVFATAPLRFTEESVGRKALARVNEYLNEASLTGLCAVCLDEDGRLCAQHHLFEDAEKTEDAVHLVADFLDCNVLPLMAAAIDGDLDPRELAYKAGRRFVAKQGNGVGATVKLLLSHHVTQDSASAHETEENHAR